MLRFIFLCFLFVAGFSGNVTAQNFVEVSSSTATVGTVNIAGKDFAGGISRTGSVFILRTSEKSGETYKSYLGTPLAGKSFNGQQVYHNKDKSEFWYYTLGKTGYPSKKLLKVE